MSVGTYRGRRARKVDRLKGFIDWVFETEDDLTTPATPRRIARVEDAEEVGQSLEYRLGLWRTGWIIDPTHGVKYNSPDETGHLDRKQSVAIPALRADLIRMTMRDDRIDRILLSPQIRIENRIVDARMVVKTHDGETIERFVRTGAI